jgi:hypothetical protein
VAGSAWKRRGVPSKATIALRVRVVTVDARAQIYRSGVSAKIGTVPAQGASSWLNPKLIVRESRIAGLGLFAIAPVERGEECCRLAGELMTEERFRVHVAGQPATARGSRTP